MVSVVTDFDGAAATAADRLLEDSWDGRKQRLSTRELRAELGITIAFLIAATTLALLSPPADAPVALTAALAVAFAVASRVEFPVGAGHAVPTQLFLIPLLLLGPPGFVPLIVLGALAVAVVFDWMAKRTRLERLVETGGDAWHSIGPAVVFVVAGHPGPAEAEPWLYVVAFVAQLTCEIGSATLREWLALGIPPQLQLRVLGIVWSIDVLLTPAAVVAAAATSGRSIPAAPLAMLGVAAVLAVLARDRNQRIDQAHARLEALHRERSRLQIAVYRIGDAFASKLDLDALLTITTRAAVEALDADGGRGSAHQGPGRKLVRRATVHEDVDLEPALRAAEDTAVALGSATVAMVDGVWALACPISEPGNAEAHGMIVLARRASAFADEERDLLRHLCEQAGVAAGNSQRHETLHRQALTDELTGLANHRRMQEILAQGAERHAAAGAHLALILFDLDNFKQVNDTRGHQTGDHVLRAVSDTLRDCCRAGDEPARYGGEELAIVVQGAAFDEVVGLAERCRAAVAALELIDMEGKDLRISTSVGVAELGPAVPDVATLIAEADAALYRAKHAGKNCVRTAAETQDEHSLLLEH